MRFTEAEVIDNMRIDKEIKQWNIFYTAFKEAPDIDKMKMYINSMVDWSICIYPRHVKYIESLIRNRYQLGLVAEEFEYTMLGIKQMFAKIESCLELEYIYRKNELQEIESDVMQEADIEALKYLMAKDKDWDKKVSDLQMQLVILVTSGYSEEVIAKSLRIQENEIYEKLFRRGSNSVVEILEKGA